MILEIFLATAIDLTAPVNKYTLTYSGEMYG